MRRTEIVRAGVAGAVAAGLISPLSGSDWQLALFVIVAAALLFSIGAAVAEPPPPEPDAYRMDAYRAPVPATLKGATVIDTSQAFDLWRRHAAKIGRAHV